MTQTQQQWTLAALMMLGIAALTLARPAMAIWGVLAVMVGWLWLWAAMRAPEPSQKSAAFPQEAAHTRWHKLAALLGVGIMAFMAFYSMGRLRVVLTLSIDVQFVIWLLGMVALTWGLAGARIQWRAVWAALRQREVQMLLLIFLLALALRLMNLGTSVRVLVDEMNTLSGAINLIHRPAHSLFWQMSSNVMPYPWHYAFLHKPPILLLGNTFFAMRVVDALIGALSVLATYGIARHLFDRKTAVLAALMLAFMPFHLHISRLALINLTDVLCVTLPVFFLLRAQAHGHRADYVLAGVCIGLSQYFYDGARLLVPPLVGLWLVIGAVWWRDQIRWRYVLWLGLAALLTAAPVYIVRTAAGAALGGRLGQAGGDLSALLELSGEALWQMVYERLIKPFGIYTTFTDETAFYWARTTMVVWWLVPFFLVGVGAALRRWRSPVLIVLLWVLAFSLGNGISIASSAHYSRYIGVTPALAILTAFGMVTVWHLLNGATWRRVARWGAVVFVVGLIAWQGVYYFSIYLPYYNVQIRQDDAMPDEEDAILRAVGLPDTTHIWLVVPHEHPVLNVGYTAFLGDFARYILNGHPHFRVLSSAVLSPDYFYSVPTDRDYAFFVWIDDEQTVPRLREHFELLPPEYTPYDDIPYNEQFVLYRTAHEE